MRKRMKCALALVLALVCLMVCMPTAEALQATQTPSSFYLTQNYRGTCTLCSATMMVRASMYLNGNPDWITVTENNMRPSAWAEGVGLWWNFSHTVGDTTVRVSIQGAYGITVSQLKRVLDTHPEGIVLYCGTLPHAVYLAGYSGDVFYCADTVAGYSGGQIPLDRSYLGAVYGSQANILKNVTSYWYVADYSVGGQSRKCDCTDAYAGIYSVKEGPLQIRSGHGLSYSGVGSIPAGAQVTVLKASGQGVGDWAHVLYNDIYGFVSMDALQRLGQSGTVTTNDLRIRSGAGTNYGVQGFYYAGARVQILETKQVGSMTWGRTERGWISLGYVKLDPVQTDAQMGTVTASSLCIRSGAGTNYAVRGYYQTGARVQIFEMQQAGSMTWGRTDKGWISLSYVKLDEAEPSAPQQPATPAAQMGTVTTNNLRIRVGAGTDQVMIGLYQAGNRVQILETRQVGSMLWGRTDKGWISMDYVKLDDSATTQTRTVTVTADCLRIRSGAGTGYTMVGCYYAGQKVQILETRQVGATTWGRTDKGWISMAYVK